MIESGTLPSPVPKRKTARNLVADYLRDAILTGELKPGEKLGVSDVATKLGVSHTPAREAFQVLAAEGLVRINEYRGADVAELSADEYEEIMLMRCPLEGLAARLGAINIDEAGIERLREHIAQLEIAAKNGDVNTFVKVDRSFHEVHYRASGRDSLWERIIRLRYAAERYTRVGYELPEVGMLNTVRTHSTLLEAIARHDGAEAERLITRDLEEIFERIHRDLLAAAKR